jgi:hypothetical protein
LFPWYFWLLTFAVAFCSCARTKSNSKSQKPEIPGEQKSMLMQNLQRNFSQNFTGKSFASKINQHLT